MTAIKKTTTYKYDYMNASTGADFTDVEPVISSYTEFDIEGHVLIESNYMPNGKIEHKSEYTFNDKGQLIQEVLINEDDFVDEKKKYEYNEKGLMVKEFLIYQDESYDTTSFNYDENGKLLDRNTVDPDGELESRREYIYENGNLIKQTNYD